MTTLFCLMSGNPACIEQALNILCFSLHLLISRCFCLSAFFVYLHSFGTKGNLNPPSPNAQNKGACYTGFEKGCRPVLLSISHYILRINFGLKSQDKKFVFFSILYPMSTLTLLRANFLTPIQLSVRSECYL